MGLLTIWPQAIHLRPDPNRPEQMQVGFDLNAGSQVLARRGLILNVSIGVDVHTAEYLRIEGQRVPDPFPCQALMDTGASCLCIDTNIAQRLGLARRGITTSFTAGGPRQSNLFAVSLLFPGTNLKTYDLIRAADVDLSAQPFKCPIGRDVMSRWHIHYNGQTGAVSIAD